MADEARISEDLPDPIETALEGVEILPGAEEIARDFLCRAIDLELESRRLPLRISAIPPRWPKFVAKEHDHLMVTKGRLTAHYQFLEALAPSGNWAIRVCTAVDLQMERDR